MARQAWYGGPRKGAEFLPVVHGNGALGASKSVRNQRPKMPRLQKQLTTSDPETDLEWMNDELIVDEDQLDALADEDPDEPNSPDYLVNTASARQRIEIAAEEAWLRSAISDFDEY